MPTDAELERSLRKAVQAYLQNPVGVPPSANSLRELVEKESGLDEGFFRRGAWKVRSKDIVQDEFDKGVNVNESDDDSASSHADAKPSKNGTKRASASSASSRPRKKSKVSKVEEDDDSAESSSISSALSEHDEDFGDSDDDKMDDDTTAKATKTEKGKPQREKEQESESEEDQEPTLSKTKPTSETAAIEDNDDTSSELSSVIDDLPPPPKTKRTSSSKTNASKPSKTPATKSKTKGNSEIAPEAEEIKRLQGWLVKCGIRKVWGKELKPYEKPKAKIAHLKNMLADAGMTGRYSNDKAAQIKEARELAADIEAVQEGNERWGKTSESDDDDGEGRRRSDAKGAESSTGTGRRLVRGAKNYDFLSSDGEETD